MPTLALLRRQLDRLQAAVVTTAIQTPQVTRDWSEVVYDEAKHPRGANGRYVGGSGAHLEQEAKDLKQHIWEVQFHAKYVKEHVPGAEGRQLAQEHLTRSHWGTHMGVPAMKARLAQLEAARDRAARNLSPQDIRELLALREHYEQIRRMPYNDPRHPAYDQYTHMTRTADAIDAFLRRANRIASADHKAAGRDGKPPKIAITQRAGREALAALQRENPDIWKSVTDAIAAHAARLEAPNVGSRMRDLLTEDTARRERQFAAINRVNAESEARSRRLHFALMNGPISSGWSELSDQDKAWSLEHVARSLRTEGWLTQDIAHLSIAEQTHHVLEAQQRQNQLAAEQREELEKQIAEVDAKSRAEALKLLQEMFGKDITEAEAERKIAGPTGTADLHMGGRLEGVFVQLKDGPLQVGLTLKKSGGKIVADIGGAASSKHGSSAVELMRGLQRLRSLGVAKATTYAAGDPQTFKGKHPTGTSGYYNWAVLGFNARLTAGVRKAAQEYFHDDSIRTIRDIITRGPQGRAWWKHHGTGFQGTLDFSDPQATHVLDRFLALQQESATTRAQVMTTDDWLSPELEEYLGKIWDELGAKPQRATPPDLRRRLASITRNANPNQPRLANGQFAPGPLKESEEKHPSLAEGKIGGEGYRAHREASRLKDALSGLKARMDALHAQGNHAAAEHVQREATWRGHKGYAAITQHYAALQRTADREAGKLGGDAHTRTALATLMQEYRARLAGAGLSDADRARLTEEVHLITEYGRKRGGVSLETSPSPQSFRLLSKAERASIREQVREALGARRVALPDLRARLATLVRRAGGPLFDIHHHFAGWIGGGEALHEADLVKAHLAAHMAAGHPAPMETMWRGGKVNIFELAKYETDLRAHAKRLAGTIHPGDEAQISHFAAQIREAANRAPDAATALEENARAAAHEAFLQLVREQRAGNGLGQYVTILSPHEIPPRTNRADVEGQVLPFSLDAFDLARATAQSITSNNVNVVTQTLIDGKPYIIKAVYGPAREPFTEAEQHHFEIMGIHLYQALGMSDLVPHAAYHVVGSDGRRYTVETVVRGITENFYREQQIMRDVSESDLQRHTLAEYVLGPRDRHMGNYIHDPTIHRLTSIDFNRGFYSIVGAAHPLQNSRPGALGLWQQQQAERQRTWKPLLRLSPHILSEVLSHRHTVVARAMALDPLTGQAIAARFDILAALWRNAGNGANADALTWDALLQLAGQRPD